MSDNRSQNGPLIGSIIIVLVILVGGYYSWKSRPLSEDSDVVGEAVEKPSQEEVVAGQTDESIVLRESTELEDIEYDAGQTDVDNLDAGLGSLESILNAE